MSFTGRTRSAEDAEQALKGLIAHDPRDASAYYNLGTVLLRGGRNEEASVAPTDNHFATVPTISRRTSTWVRA